MSVPLVINGVTFQYPQQFDKNWGPTLTNWSTAVTNGMLQKGGGVFTLTAETDFGTSYGLKVKSLKSQESNIAQTGVLRLANASAGVVWRNAANGADLPLTVNASNQLTFNGTSIGATTALTDGHILVGNVTNQPADVPMTGDISITDTGLTSIGSGKVLDTHVGASAAIALSKLATLSVSQLVVTNGSGILTTSASPTLIELSYLSGVSGALQTQLNSLTSSYLPLVGGTMSGPINMASQKIVSVANGTVAGDAVNFGQLPIITPWVVQTLVVAGAGTLAASTLYTRRVGDSMEGMFNFKAGIPTGVALTLTLPGGLTADTTKILGNGMPLGFANKTTAGGGAGVFVDTGGSVLYLETVSYTDATKISVCVRTVIDGINYLYTPVLGNAYLNQGSEMGGRFTVPIVGWA